MFKFKMFKGNDIDRRIEALLKSQEELMDAQKRAYEELKEAQKKTDEQLKQTDFELREMFKKTDEELSKMSKKSDKEFEKTRKLVAGVSNGLGRLSEGFALASVKKIFKGLGITIEDTCSRKKITKDGNTIELDLLSIGNENGNKIAIAIETKTYLRKDDVDDFLKDLEKFYTFFDEYKNFPLQGGLAFMNSSENVKKYAEENGLYLFSLGEDSLTLANSKGFKPNIWRFSK